MKDLVTQINNAVRGKGQGTPVSKARRVGLLPNFAHCGGHLEFVETYEGNGPGKDWVCCQECGFALPISDCDETTLNQLRVPDGYVPSLGAPLSWWGRFSGRSSQKRIMGAR